MKKLKHRHDWKQARFLGDALIHMPWTCRVILRCECNAEMERTATEKEVQAEIDRLLCEVCGQLRHHHPPGAEGDPGRCINVLVTVIDDIQRRLKELESWRSG